MKIDKKKTIWGVIIFLIVVWIIVNRVMIGDFLHAVFASIKNSLGAL